MNINTNVYKQYINSGSKYSKAVQKSFSIPMRKTGIKQDSLSFSAEASLLKESSGAVKSCASQIAKPESDERIDSLRRRIKNGEYNVSATQIADSILDRWI